MVHSRHAKLITWRKKQQHLAEQDSLPSQDFSLIQAEDHEREQHLHRVKLSEPRGEMITRIGEKLLSIINQEVDSLELMVEDELLAVYYSTLIFSRPFLAAVEFTNTLAHQYPHMRICEVGGGTGSLTLPILRVLGGNDGRTARCRRCDFTDTDSSFLEAASTTFVDWASILHFQKLDIEVEPSIHGFEENRYDLVIAGQVLHATANISNTMWNVRKLLKPGGKHFLRSPDYRPPLQSRYQMTCPLLRVHYFPATT